MNGPRTGSAGSHGYFSSRTARRLTVVALGSALVAAFSGLLPASPAQAAATITVNGGSGGRVFDGVGAISGGGGNSRLLVDYPEPQRGQILDYLFKPGYGSAMQMMKIEIGGDTNSTSGAEPSHEHVRGQVNCNRGYEWWLAGQAKARNPNIKLYGLAWGAPGWIGNGNFWTNDSINYLIGWLDCAKTHGLTIDYLGGWNERGSNTQWWINLRSALNSRGYSNVKLVGTDNWGWGDAPTVLQNSSFRNAISVLGSHYICGYRGPQSSCPSSADAIATGKPLWASENGSDDYNDGAPALARGINRVYIDGKMTGYFNWPVIAAITPNLPWATMGVSVAPQPWSGYYAIGKSTWVMAHTTQFTSPGWRYLDSGTGYLNGQRGQGSYVSLRSPAGNDWSAIVETMDATSAQTLTFNVSGGLSTGQVHLWATNVRSGNTSDHFVRAADLTPSNGSVSFNAQPGYVYSLTTTTGQGKGTATAPARANLALPHQDSFDSYTTGGEAKYLMDHQGSFEITGCGGGRTGQCVRQMSENTPIYWTTGHADPFTLLGDMGWRDYTVSSDFMLERSGYVKLIGRAGNYPHEQPQNLNSYFLRITDGGAWAIQANNTSGNVRTLASGNTAAPGTNRWHSFALTFSGSSITATLDGNRLGSANDSAFGTGQVGYGTGTSLPAQFDNLSVYSGTPPTTTTTTRPPTTTTTTTTRPPTTTTTTTRPPTTTTTTSGSGGAGSIVAASGKCLDVSGTGNSSAAQIATCNGSSGQSWTLTSSGELRTLNASMCLDASGRGTANGTPLIIYTCNGQPNQQWSLGSNGSIVGAASGRCVDVPNGVSTDGTALQLYDCWGGDSQKWTVNTNGGPTTTTTSRPTTTTTTTTSPQTTTTTTTTVGGGTGGCSATYTTTGSWSGGFQGDVTVKNTGTSTTTSWTVTMNLASGQSISSMWSGTPSASTGSVKVTNVAYNGTLTAAGTTSFGFIGVGNSTPAPTVTCTAG